MKTETVTAVDAFHWLSHSVCNPDRLHHIICTLSSDISAHFIPGAERTANVPSPLDHKSHFTHSDGHKEENEAFIFLISFHLLMIHSFNVIPHQQLCFLKSSYFQIIMRYKFRIKNSSEKEEQ